MKHRMPRLLPMRLSMGAVVCLGCASIVRATNDDPLDATVPPDVVRRDASVDLPRVPLDAVPDRPADVTCTPSAHDTHTWILRVYPRSASRLTGRRPTFRWRGGLAGVPVALEICRDRACKRVITRYVTSEQHFTPPDDLPAGVLYWNLKYVGCDGTLRPATFYRDIGDRSLVGQSLGWSMKVPNRRAPETRSWGAFFDHDADGIEDLLVAERGLVVSLHHGTPTGPRRRLLHAGNTQPDGRGVFNVVGDMSGGGLSEVLIASSYNEPWTPPFVGHFVTAHDPSPGTFGYGRLERSLLTVRFPYPTTGMVAAAGDVNDDGFGDALVGLGLVGAREPGLSSGDPVFSPETHRVWTVYGAREGQWRNSPMRPIPPQLNRMRLDSFGYAMTGIGDFNDDGFDDVVISGSALTSASEQWSHVYLGSSNGLPERPTWAIDLRTSLRESLGNPVRALGDASGDGLVDFLIPRGTRSTLTLHFFSRQSSQFRGQLHSAESMVVQDGAYNAGEPFIAVLDANGDGLQDLIIANTPTSCSWYPGTGRWFGAPRLGIPLQPLRTTPAFSTGDYNGDGYDDLAVGDPEQQRVLIYPGSPSGPQTTAPIVLRGDRGFGMWVM